MKTVIIASLIASAAAFAPSQKGASSTALSSNKFSNEVGVQAPLGFFDPLGLLSTEDDSTFAFLREAEIKHGRIAQLAVVGYLTTYAGYRIPGMEDIPAGLGVFNKELYSPNGLAQLNVYWTMVTILTLELVFMKDAYGKAEFPGDYLSSMDGRDVRWYGKSDEFKKDARAKELNNGRAAMMGIWGLVVHESMGNVDELLPWLNHN